MQAPDGKSIAIDPTKHAASAHGILACQDCHSSIKDYPHPAKVQKVQCVTCHADESSHLENSAHAAPGTEAEACQSCHGNVHELTETSHLAPGKCAECHDAETKQYHNSIHGQAAAKGDPDAPRCTSCHGPIHQIRSAGEASSLVAKVNLPRTCASCHSNQQFLSRHNIPFTHPVEQYQQSVHGRISPVTREVGAACSDCHGTHDILAARDQHSRINHWNIPATCGRCHAEIAKIYLESVHGQAVKASVSDSPVCTDCHGEHLILGPKEAGSLVNASRVSTVTCGRCHSDERLAARYNIPNDRVPSYADSYHGLARRGGSQTVANCASCHGVHNIFPASDARSMVNASNLPRTCGNCHAGAGEYFAIGPVHVQTSTGPAHPLVKTVRMIYWVLIPLTLGFMTLHNLLDFVSKLIRRRRRREKGPKVVRMDQYFLLVHWGLIVSFSVLVVSGFALKYPDAIWAQPLLHWEGHLAVRGALHRAAALVLIATMAFHLFSLAFKRGDSSFLQAMTPRWKDVSDIFRVLSYNLGMRKDSPQFGKYNYAEKLEYWAFMWGTALMTASGFLLWFNDFTLRHFPKWVADVATAVHYYEAVLATFSILLWHFYMVIFDPEVYPMDLTWLDGKVRQEHYRESRPEYLHSLEDEARQKASPKTPDTAPADNGDRKRPDTGDPSDDNA
jgi:formate dehydrogenase gamma subunit